MTLKNQLLVAHFCGAFLFYTNTSAATDCGKFSEPDFWHAASNKGVSTCLKEGINIFSRTKKSGETPLHWATSYSSNPEIIDTLLLSIKNEKQRLDYINARDEEGKSALHLASEMGRDPAMLVRLVSWGADVDVKYGTEGIWRFKKGTTPLHLAIKNKESEEMVTTLLALGADPDIADNRGRTPLHYVSEKDIVDMRVLALLLIHSDPNIKDNDGNTSLHLMSPHNTNINAVRYLVRKGADANETNKDGQTPLQLAAAYNSSSEIVSYLLERTEHPCKADDEGRTAYSNIKQNAALADSRVYWDLHALCFEKNQ